MAGTGTAYANDYEATFTNPALLSRLRSRSFSLGYEAAVFNLRATVAENANIDFVRYMPFKSSIIAIAVPLPLRGALKDRIGVSFAFSTPMSLIVRGRIVYPERGQFPLLPDRAQSLAIRMGLGVDLGHGLRVGAGFAALSQVVGSVIVATDASGKVGSRVEDELVATYAPIVGVSYERSVLQNQTLRVGATFRGQLAARFAIDIDATKLSSLPLPVFNIAGTAQFDPMQVQAEIALEGEHGVVALGATYKRWSAFKGLLEPTIPCPPEACNALRPPVIDYSDTVTPRGAAEGRFDLTKSLTASVRAGIAYEPTPLPEQLPASNAFDMTTGKVRAVPTRYYDANRILFSLGGGIALHDPLPPIRIDVFSQVHALIRRSMKFEQGEDASVSGAVLVGGVAAGVSF